MGGWSPPSLADIQRSDAAPLRAQSGLEHRAPEAAERRRSGRCRGSPGACLLRRRKQEAGNWVGRGHLPSEGQPEAGSTRAAGFCRWMEAGERSAHSSGKDTKPALNPAVIGACYCFRLDNTRGVSEPAGEPVPFEERSFWKTPRSETVSSDTRSPQTRVFRFEDLDLQISGSGPPGLWIQIFRFVVLDLQVRGSGPPGPPEVRGESVQSGRSCSQRLLQTPCQDEVAVTVRTDEHPSTCQPRAEWESGDMHASDTHVHASDTHVHASDTHVHASNTHMHASDTHVHASNTHMHASDTHVHASDTHVHASDTHVRASNTHMHASV
ncbi:uncharacterized protein FQA47_011046 [Oryzias melastigma]|uniref:Uncharacterized protein n=1 Tax=Oryzias melastigma TaxID=30732 RepID=A0A834EZY8_ORYME|nr:uncharacterized protein FQA47_011046 [Oryzias melastigma]